MAPTIQRAALDLLSESGRPMKSQELAKLALDRGLVFSRSRTPANSLAQTIEKNIRDGVEPRLAFVHRDGVRHVALPEWGSDPTKHATAPTAASKELRVVVSADLLGQIGLALQAGLGRTLDDTVQDLLRRGLACARDEIKSGVMAKLDSL